MAWAKAASPVPSILASGFDLPVGPSLTGGDGEPAPKAANLPRNGPFLPSMVWYRFSVASRRSKPRCSWDVLPDSRRVAACFSCSSASEKISSTVAWISQTSSNSWAWMFPFFSAVARAFNRPQSTLRDSDCLLAQSSSDERPSWVLAPASETSGSASGFGGSGSKESRELMSFLTRGWASSSQSLWGPSSSGRGRRLSARSLRASR